MNEEKNFKITPSGVDYALKCKRCLWLAYKGIKLDAFFPPIFNAFDLIQKKFLINKSVKTMSKDLPDGRIMTELSGYIGSTGRATGAHLDVRLNWLQIRLDPATVLDIKN